MAQIERMAGSSPDDKAIPWIAASKSSDQKQFWGVFQLKVI